MLSKNFDIYFYSSHVEKMIHFTYQSSKFCNGADMSKKTFKVPLRKRRIL